MLLEVRTLSPDEGAPWTVDMNAVVNHHDVEYDGQRSSALVLRAAWSCERPAGQQRLARAEGSASPPAEKRSSEHEMNTGR